MYDPTIGQFLSEDPIEFEGLDENLRRYVRNRALVATDPSGLLPVDDAVAAIANDQQISPEQPPGGAFYPVNPNRFPPLFVYLNFINATTSPSGADIANSAIDGANSILNGQAGVILQHNGLTNLPVKSDAGSVQFNADTGKFTGGGLNGMTLQQGLAATPSGPGQINVILVDKLIIDGEVSYGGAYGIGNPNGSGIVVAVNYGRGKNDDTPERTLAHEVGNFFGLRDTDRSGSDAQNLMSYRKRIDMPFGVIGTLIMLRGTCLTDSQIEFLRNSIYRW